MCCPQSQCPKKGEYVSLPRPTGLGYQSWTEWESPSCGGPSLVWGEQGICTGMQLGAGAARQDWAQLGKLIKSVTALRITAARFLSIGQVEREESQHERCCLIWIGGFQDTKIDTKINTNVSVHVKHTHADIHDLALCTDRAGYTKCPQNNEHIECSRLPFYKPFSTLERTRSPWRSGWFQQLSQGKYEMTLKSFLAPASITVLKECEKLSNGHRCRLEGAPTDQICYISEHTNR